VVIAQRAVGVRACVRACVVRGWVRGCAAAVVESVLSSHYDIDTDGGGGGGGGDNVLRVCSIARRGKPQVGCASLCVDNIARS